MAVNSFATRSTDVYESRQPEILKKTIPFMVLATLAVIARYFSRRFRKASLGADDYFSMASLILCWGNFVIVIVNISFGVGKHVAVAPKGFITPKYKVSFVNSIVYATSITTIKVSILLFYQRVFGTPKFKLIIRTVLGVVVAWWTAVILVQVFSCNPVQGFWNTSIPSACLIATRFYTGAAVPNILTDVFILCLPVPMIWHLQISRHQKIGLTVTFLTGAFVIVPSLYRLILLHEINLTDPMWSRTDVVIWTYLEPSVGLVCACLPTLRPLLREALQKGEALVAIVRSATDRSRLDDGIQLESRYTGTHGKGSTYHTRWVDEELSFGAGANVAGATAVTSSAAGLDPERDDKLLAGTEVWHKA